MADTLKDKLTNIAGAIREKNGDPPTTKYSLDTMADKIRALGTPLIEGDIMSPGGSMYPETKRVCRQGDAVMVNVVSYNVQGQVIMPNEKIFTLPDGWVPSTNKRIRCIKKQRDIQDCDIVYVDIKANDRGIYTVSAISAFEYMYISIWFEAVPLT